MSARIIPLPIPAPGPDRAQARRDGIVRDVSVALRAHELTLRCTVPTLGPDGAKRTLQAVRDKLQHELGRIESVIDEYLELEATQGAEATD